MQADRSKGVAATENIRESNSRTGVSEFFGNVTDLLAHLGDGGALVLRLEVDVDVRHGDALKKAGGGGDDGCNTIDFLELLRDSEGNFLGAFE